MAMDKPGAERFTGPESIYTVPAGPAGGPAAYNPTEAKPSVSVPSFDKAVAERFTGPDSIYRKVRRISAGPPLAYVPCLPPPCGRSQPTPTGGTHIVRTAQPVVRGSLTVRACWQGLRQSTIPTQQCSDLPSKSAIAKAPAGSFERGAALKAALSASMDFRVGRSALPKSIPE